MEMAFWNRRMTLVLFCVAVCGSSLMEKAQGRPGKPFHPCGSYIVAISFSLSRPHHVQQGMLFSVDEGEKALGFQEWGFVSHEYRHRPRVLPDNRPKASATSSFYKRAEDVLSILISLVLGALTGAVTASLIHLLWSIATHRYDADSDDENLHSNVDPDFGYQKLPSKDGDLGYQKVPAKDAGVVSDAK
eukprot:TRINITY_DN247_c0_g1_i1.p1 TRINITY_DN247_c0_g1~~TRINITY_DN247_c0_g1_i1.p1  ORF type:complete len:189 (-),score=21.38 TRINITY_DN247_c0_g1_i1:311-877(-)